MDWGVLFTNNSLIVLDGEVVGLRLATRLHLDAVITKTGQIVDFEVLISLSLKFSFLFIPCPFCIISSTLGG